MFCIMPILLRKHAIDAVGHLSPATYTFDPENDPMKTVLEFGTSVEFRSDEGVESWKADSRLKAMQWNFLS